MHMHNYSSGKVGGGRRLRASPEVLGMRSCTVKLDEENPN
jgi:hypothetical protein